MDLGSHQIIFYLFGIIPIRDTIVMTVILDVIIIAVVLLIRKAYPSLIESIMKFITSMVGDILDVDNIYPYLPILGSLFIFLFFANILSVIPGLRSPTSDINTTLALAIVVFFAVHIYGIRNKGLIGYLKTLSDPFFLLPLDIISQLSRTLSLTLRLFGNILSGEIIVAIVFSIIPLLAPVPFIALSMLSGVLQAYILTTLATLYISSAVEINRSEKTQQKIN
jgi:F-type H+-transporting ATPase subunit a